MMCADPAVIQQQSHGKKSKAEHKTWKQAVSARHVMATPPGGILPLPTCFRACFQIIKGSRQGADTQHRPLAHQALGEAAPSCAAVLRTIRLTLGWQIGSPWHPSHTILFSGRHVLNPSSWSFESAQKLSSLASEPLPSITGCW